MSGDWLLYAHGRNSAETKGKRIMVYHNAHCGISMTTKAAGKSFVVTVSHEATKHSLAFSKTQRVKCWSGVEKIIKKWNLTQV
jgi:hypothetical protein